MNQHPNDEKGPNRFESDTQKIMRRHLTDPNHVITEEEIASIRIGMTPVSYPRPLAALRIPDPSKAEKNAGSPRPT